MNRLFTANFDDADGFYADLLSVHEGLSEAQSHALNARLVLLLANVVGDRDVLRRAFEMAKQAQ